MNKVPNGTTEEQIKKVATALISESFKMKEPGEVQLLLESVAYAMGSVITRFQPQDRGKIILELTRSIAQGMMDTSENIKEDFDFTMIVKEENI